MNLYQTVAAQTYAGGEFAHVTDPKEPVGDTLFTFIMIELSDSEGCDSVEEAVRRMDKAFDELLDITLALEKLA